ncbi:hypothetical protein L3081_03360 [Colwellia sp. MSW7]|uniref:Uncharacterized protein n=1 Tax=Colwellia maritima TaxID=2912588 RepID=A0ABS9WXI0_9GAMM|nr:hypothetical protein [Colwellia maritima]MCI2282616.1 hypothetical protein [Colwellia maritima]
MDNELKENVSSLKRGEQLVTTYQKKKISKTPPYITVGNGLSTTKFSEEVVVDAFKVFSELSKAQQDLFVDLKDILVAQSMHNHYNKRKVENPNLIILDRSRSNLVHQNIKTKMSQNRNRKMLETKGILKQIKPGIYMLNPYIFIPHNDFQEVVSIWKELSSKS